MTISTGNDIVALGLLDHQRSETYRFYSKIITPTEKELYGELGNTVAGFSVFVWICWSVKESAYKYLKRIDAALVFSPTRFRLQRITPALAPEEFDIHVAGSLQRRYFEGHICVNETTLVFRTMVSEQLIATTIINHSPVLMAVHEIENEMGQEQSAAVRMHCLTRLKQLFSKANLKIVTHAAGYPVIMDNDHVLPVPLSFAHHGRFVSYSLPLEGKEQVAGLLHTRAIIY